VEAEAQVVEVEDHQQVVLELQAWQQLEQLC